MLKVKITIEQDDKKAELELTEADNLQKMMIIQNVFNLFGVKQDIVEQVSTFDKISAAYASFFDEVTPIEPIVKPVIQIDKNEIKEQLIEGYKSKDELESTYKAVNDHNKEHLISGIKIDSDGTKRYRLKYVCTKCSNSGIHYVYETSKRTWCHRCDESMVILPAAGIFLSKDENGVFFRAGRYQV